MSCYALSPYRQTGVTRFSHAVGRRREITAMFETKLDLLQAIDTNRGRGLDAHDIAVMVCLLRELRDTTPSRRSFAEATRFLQRLAGERDGSNQDNGEPDSPAQGGAGPDHFAQA
jgi:hypothetical protein